ncbi:glycosyl hydrolase 115 family protein [Microbacter margulisiae]|uniref:Gylcosyl hydrolase 115 C-terminal domain-containing protein n=1 Tax=Microbacter margulisiae TaxID=1350067 RepID=A0A7W5DQ85_9PORP|nr:glycosyl hydrolase 115 family protein [Microbacter margulisiae]MBB3186961.1 hypothetical protein [Microbacter margulisiae]
MIIKTQSEKWNFRMSYPRCVTNLIGSCLAVLFTQFCYGATPVKIDFSGLKSSGVVLAGNGHASPILVESTNNEAVLRAAHDLANDFYHVTGCKPKLIHGLPDRVKNIVIAGTLGSSPTIDRLAAKGILKTTGIKGKWESFVWQIIKNPLPGISHALVIAGSDRRGTIYGIYELSQRIGVSPWYWWADVPVRKQRFIRACGERFVVGPPAVKYRGIFLNDEDWGLRPWASKTFDPKIGNIGPKTYARIFELLLRLRANYLWPAMHPGTTAFNAFPQDAKLADEYGIVMGSSHCEQMLRNNISEWNEKEYGAYNFVTNAQGVLKYWEQRIRENGKYENIYTLGMRGISDSGMPGGGTLLQKAQRLHTIISDQRKMLARWVNPNVRKVPQIFCPYKEVLPLYHLMPKLPDDITLMWPDDNYGYIREFSNAQERKRHGGAGVYYHVSYWGRPHDYLWLCSTSPGLIAEEMTKACDYGANKVWILNVGDLKPAELDIEYFLHLAWNPHAWNGMNTYDLLEKQFTRDFGAAYAPKLTSIMSKYYRLNFQRKPEHMLVNLTNTFSTTLNGDEAEQRIEAWQKLSTQAVAVGKTLPVQWHDAFFELVGYPVEAAAAMNEKCLALDEYYTGIHQNRIDRLTEAREAQAQIHRLTDIYNNQIAGGKWRYMMSDNPRGQLTLNIPQLPQNDTNDVVRHQNIPTAIKPSPVSSCSMPGADFVEKGHHVIMEAEHASAFIPGKKGVCWRKIAGVGYNGEAVTVFPRLIPVLDQPKMILKDSPCLEYKVCLKDTGIWKVTVRALPTFSVQAGKPQRYAIAFDNASPKIISLPYSTSEYDRQWQQDVLRNAALTTSLHAIHTAGLHILKIWMVDPGIVIDAIEAESGNHHSPLGYVWPSETKN